MNRGYDAPYCTKLVQLAAENITPSPAYVACIVDLRLAASVHILRYRVREQYVFGRFYYIDET